MPDGVALEQLLRALPEPVSRRTFQRQLAEWVNAGVINAEGTRKARRYFAPQKLSASAASKVVAAREGGPWTEASLSADAQEIRRLVQRPISDRLPVGYRREFLDAYEPNVNWYLSADIRRHLFEIGRTPDGVRPAGTYAREILNRFLIDLSWASSHLEGNTYSLLDTERLIQEGVVPAGKDAKETQMILNHKSAIELLVESAAEVTIDRYSLLNLHAVLADNLLEHERYAGRLRDFAIGIGGSTYLPSAVPQLIEEQFEQLVTRAAAIRDPFEQSFFLLVHLPYLQPFADVNKRTSRLAANIPLIQQNLVPLSFIDLPEKAYVDGLIGVYEQNRVELLRDVFIWAYERSCRRYKSVRDSVPEPDAFRLRYREAFIAVIGRIIREQIEPSASRVSSLAAALVSVDDLEPFIEVALRELDNLYEGNIARFRLRPSEFRRWRELFPAGS